MHCHSANRLVNALVFFFIVTVVSHHSHGGFAALALMIIAGGILWTHHRQHHRWSGCFWPPASPHSFTEIWFTRLIWLLFAIYLFGVLYQPDGLSMNWNQQSHALDRPSRWILLLPLLWLFRRWLLDWRWIAMGLSVGSFLALGLAAHEVYILGQPRASVATSHAIPFGQLMVAIDLLSWMLMLYAWQQGHKTLGILLLIASVAAFYASLLSATRGAWLAYVLMIAVWLIHAYRNGQFNRQHLLSKPVVVRLLAFVALFYAISFTPQYQLMQQKSWQELQQLQQGNYLTSGGMRLLMWQVGWESVERYPLGVGTDNYQAIKTQLLAENPWQWSEQAVHVLAGFGHAHNEWLNLWVENGIQGILFMALLLGLATWVFWRYLSHPNALVTTYAAMGLMLIWAYVIFGMTQALFSHHVTTIFFIFWLYLLWGQVQLLNQQSPPET